MIELCSPLGIEADPQGQWQRTLTVGDAFNYATPFRSMLAEIASALGQDGQTGLRLPAYEAGEDFVEGTLQFGSVQLAIYYEHALSYLALMSDTEQSLRDVAGHLQSVVKIS